MMEWKQPELDIEWHVFENGTSLCGQWIEFDDLKVGDGRVRPRCEKCLNQMRLGDV